MLSEHTVFLLAGKQFLSDFPLRIYEGVIFSYRQLISSAQSPVDVLSSTHVWKCWPLGLMFSVRLNYYLFCHAIVSISICKHPQYLKTCTLQYCKICKVCKYPRAWRAEVVILSFKMLIYTWLHSLLQSDSDVSMLCIPDLLQIKCEQLWTWVG